jgi:hypothetical protein
MNEANIRSTFLCTTFSSSGCSMLLVTWLINARRSGDMRLSY